MFLAQPAIIPSWANFILISLLLSLCLIITPAESKASRLGHSCVVFSQRTSCGDLVCNKTTHVCVHCNEPGAAACDEHNVFRCTSKGTCEVTPIWDKTPVDWGLPVAVVLSLFVTALGVVCGLGGGGVLVPMYTILLSFPASMAVALSQVTILGQMLFNLMVIIRRHHPHHRQRPMISYDALLVVLPMTLAGTTLGNMIGRIIPDWLRLFLLLILVGFVAKKGYVKAKKQKVVDEE
eukprot:PhM_4_TR17405/c0_g1_i2/m.69775